MYSKSINSCTTHLHVQYICNMYIFPDIISLLQTWELSTGGSCLSCTAVKPDSHLAQIFVAKYLCIIKLIIIHSTLPITKLPLTKNQL